MQAVAGNTSLASLQTRHVPLQFIKCYWSRCPPWNMIFCFFLMSFRAFVCMNIVQSMSIESIIYQYLVSVRVWTTSGLEKESRNWGKAKQLECIEGRVMRTNQRLKGWWQIIQQRFRVYIWEILVSRIKFLSDKPSYAFCYVALWCRLTCSVCGCHRQLTAPATTLACQTGRTPSAALSALRERAVTRKQSEETWMAV